MKHMTHIAALVITVVSVVIFLILKGQYDWVFGLRTYWPVFVCVYLIVWYVGESLKQKSVET